MGRTCLHMQGTLYSGICVVNIPAPKMSPWQRSPGQHPPGVLWDGGDSAACTVCSVTTSHGWPAAGRQGSQGLMWASYGEVECAPFLEVEREKAEEPAVELWLTPGVDRQLLPWSLLHPTGSVQNQQPSREPFWGQHMWYSILFQGGEIESSGCCAYKAWSCLGDDQIVL